MQFNDLKLCQTCLSRDRLLYPIKVLNYLFEELNIYVVNEGSICWECKFTMIKLSNFKKRVKEAQELLTFQPQTHRTLSRLGTHVTNSIDIFYNNDDPLTINTKFEHIKIEIQEHQEATNIDDTNETTDLNKEFFDEIDVEIDPEVKVEFKDELSLDLVKKSEDNVDNVRDKFSTIMYNEQELMDVREEKKNHPNFRKMPFICHSCVLGFTKRETYDVHVKSKHDETNGDYVCDVCHIRFRTLRIMEFHRQIHFVTYKCNLCKYEGKSLRSIISHCESKHEKDCVGIINCKQCDVTAKTQEEMAEHIRIKHLLFCAECGEKFKDRGGLRKHVMRIHRANREFICDFCRKSFKTKSKLESHIVIHNSTLAMNLSYCRVCNVQYKNIYVYRNHLKNSPNHSERSSSTLKKSAEGGRNKKEEDEKELVEAAFFDNDQSQGHVIDEIIKKRKLQNKIRCQRYRAKRKNAVTTDSGIPKDQTVTVEEDIIIKRRREKNKQKSKRYRDKKRATNLINLQTDRLTKIIEKHVPNRQNFCTSQIPGPSTRNVPYLPPTPGYTPGSVDRSLRNKLNIPESHTDYDDNVRNDVPLQVNYPPKLDEPIMVNYASNPQNIIPCDAQNNIQNMRSQHNLSVQIYSSFQENSSAHREFQKDFLENEFGQVCDICDRLWFKKDLKVFVNNNTTPNIQFIRTMLVNANLTEVKICSTCLASIYKHRVPPLSVYNGFKYSPLPENLRNSRLDLVTERLISPRIPFMQIRRLRHIQGQFEIYGQAMNIPINVNTMVHSLPRNIGDDHSITVHVKRTKIQEPSNICGVINKRKLKMWLRYLKDTPLYTSYGITIDDDFLNSQDDEQDEITYDEEGDSDISEQIPIDESLIAQQQTLIWNDEDLRTVPGEGVSLFDEHAEELSFPQIYLGQFRTFRDGFSVTPFMMASSELKRSDRRGATPQHLLYLAMKIMRIRIRESLSVALDIVNKEQIETEDYVQGGVESNMAFLRTIPNSAYYWSERKKDLFAMVRQYGKPTVFFTINANEIGWPKLLQLLHNLKSNPKILVEDAAALHFIEKSTLVNEDGVTCVIYFNQLINVLMKILQSKRFSPFKKYRILYYFKRIEFQRQGSPRARILAWLDNAPEDALEKGYDKAIDLIDFLISVSETETSGNIELQIHKHTSTCYKGVSSKGMNKCRFEAPYMPIKKTMILTPMKDTEDRFEEYNARYNDIRKNLENYEYIDFQTFYEDNNIYSDQEYVDIIRTGIKRPTVFPKRQPNEKWHNPFNPFILNIVKSNTDFQFIIDEYSCAAYVVEFFNKTNRGVSDLQRKIIEIIGEHPEFDVFDITKNISNDLLNHTEMTSQEAAWYLLREPIAKSSTTVAYIPTVKPFERQKMKKTMKESSELDDDCSDIWKENWFDKYKKRPEDLEDVSLAQFVSKYYKNAKGECAERVEPRVIRYRNYDMADLNEYKREMVTLYIPFRDEEADVLENMKFIILYDENVDLILQKRKEFESNVDIERILQICRELCREEVPDDKEEIGDVGRLPDQNSFQELHNNRMQR